MKEYEFNDCGVCINPDEVSYDSGRCGYTLATAYTDDNSDRYALVPKDIIAKLDEVLHPQPVQLTLFDW